MTLNKSNVRIFGDLGTEVFLAPKGSVLPEDVNIDPDAPFEGLGWLSEGIDVDISVDVYKAKGVGGVTLRTKVTGTERTIKFQCPEDTPGVRDLYYGITTPDVVTGAGAAAVAKSQILPERLPTIQRAAVFKNVDEGITEYLCCTNIEITDRGTLSYKSDKEKIYEFTVELVGDLYILTNDPVFTGV
ncbi:hypothetical protein [Paenarthrobacter nitroguajacolicus]|uniref:hypothetical protein n=1 Tax=Paenarthrobacter nitroguajacolicus TaxID=211146 RepID=UPI00248CA9C9|nr:hypothetical protein [Paenarthrobacter nitroguajacolicus]MDI2032997.1 hypothetical protein [Paenarthrobacter nitroguajacolicus]